MTSEKIRLRFIFIYYNTIVRTAFLQHIRPTQFAQREELCVVVYYVFCNENDDARLLRSYHTARQHQEGVSGSPSLARNRFTLQTCRTADNLVTLQFALDLSSQHNFMRGAIESCERINFWWVATRPSDNKIICGNRVMSKKTLFLLHLWFPSSHRVVLILSIYLTQLKVHLTYVPRTSEWFLMHFCVTFSL